MFELFDQFIYISIMMFGAYITLYIKNRSYAGILLIACSILSNILLLSVVLNPFVFITLPITAILLYRDWVEDYKSGRVSRKHKIGAGIATLIVIYDALFIVKLSNFHLLDSASLFMVGSIIGTITGFYLIIYPFKEMMSERQANVQRIAQEEYMALESEEQIAIADVTSIHDIAKATTTDVEPKQQTSTKLGAENSGPKRPTEPRPKIFGIDSLYVLVGGGIFLLLIGSIIFNIATRTVIDMQDYVFVTVDPTASHDAEVGYYASFEHFDENNFYNDLIETGSEYGLTDEEIAKYTPVYTPENKQMFNKLDIKVANDMETVNNGDVVTTNITYDEEYAIKNNIVIENTNFETKIDSLPAGVEDIKDVDQDELKELSTAAIISSKESTKYNLENIEPQFSYITDSGYVDVLVTYDGQVKSGIFGADDSQVTFLVSPYTKNQSLEVSSDVEIVNLTDYEAIQF